MYCAVTHEMQLAWFPVSTQWERLTPGAALSPSGDFDSRDGTDGMSTTLIIHMLGRDDSSVLNCVAPDVFDNTIDPRWTAEYLADPRHHMAVAIIGEQVVGMASAVHYVHPDKAPELWVNEVGVARRIKGRALDDSSCGLCLLVAVSLAAAKLGWGPRKKTLPRVAFMQPWEPRRNLWCMSRFGSLLRLARNPAKPTSGGQSRASRCLRFISNVAPLDGVRNAQPVATSARPEPHPLFRVVAGGIAEWEAVAAQQSGSRQPPRFAASSLNLGV
jgi:hypothetical protein